MLDLTSEKNNVRKHLFRMTVDVMTVMTFLSRSGKVKSYVRKDFEHQVITYRSRRSVEDRKRERILSSILVRTIKNKQ